MKLKLFFALLLSLSAYAELTPSAQNKPKDRYYSNFEFDFSSLNQMNDQSVSIPEEQVLQDWQNFLSTAPMTSEVSKDNLIFVANQYDRVRMIVDGQLQLPLLRAMVRTYREDLETLYTLGTQAIKGTSSSDMYKDELFWNKSRVYNCWIVSSLSPLIPDDCLHIKKVIALNEADTEKLRMAFIRLIRVGSLDFNHVYCESYQDPVLIAEHKRIGQVKEFPSNAYKNNFSFFGAAPREYRSLPTLVSKLEGPYLKTCTTSRSSQPLDHRIFRLDMWEK